MVHRAGRRVQRRRPTVGVVRRTADARTLRPTSASPDSMPSARIAATARSSAQPLPIAPRSSAAPRFVSATVPCPVDLEVTDARELERRLQFAIGRQVRAAARTIEAVEPHEREDRRVHDAVRGDRTGLRAREHFEGLADAHGAFTGGGVDAGRVRCPRGGCSSARPRSRWAAQGARDRTVGDAAVGCCATRRTRCRAPCAGSRCARSSA